MGFLNRRLADNSHREVDVSQVAVAVSAKTHTVIDVREKDEWNDGHIAGAVHIPFRELARRAAELLADKSIFIVCHSGSRSLVAIDILDASGCTGTKSLAGGVVSWAQSSKPLVR